MPTLETLNSHGASFRKAGFLYLLLADIIHLQAHRKVKDLDVGKCERTHFIFVAVILFNSKFVILK